MADDIFQLIFSQSSFVFFSAYLVSYTSGFIVDEKREPNKESLHEESLLSTTTAAENAFL